MTRDVTEGRIDGELSAEIGPHAEDFVMGLIRLFGVSGVGFLESIAEVSLEAVSGERVSSCQGLGCG